MLLLISFFVWKYASNPERILRGSYNLCFDKNSPGANDRYVQYKFFYCDDSSKSPVQENLDLGGDWAELRLRNKNGDALLILEPKVPWGSADCVNPVESIWKITRNDQKKVHFDLVSKNEVAGPCEGIDGR